MRTGQHQRPHRRKNPKNPGSYSAGGSLYHKLRRAKIPLDHHESDLYAKVTPDSSRIVERSGKSKTIFRSQVDGELWYDIPFGYAPFWDKVHKRSIALGGAMYSASRKKKRYVLESYGVGEGWSTIPHTELKLIDIKTKKQVDGLTFRNDKSWAEMEKMLLERNKLSKSDVHIKKWREK